MDPLKDSKSNVELLDCMGSDLTVVNAARVSFDKVSTELTEADRKLIRYLARNNHISPFFHPQVQFRIKMPIFVAREWFRHTIGFARNEVSRRYVDSEPECWIPKPEEIRERDPNLKQGSKPDAIKNAEEVYELIMKKSMNDSMESYNKLLENNVAPEVARCVLPVSHYTEFIETASEYALFRLCKLRLDPHALKEIQLYAAAIDKIMSERFPVSWAALSETYNHTK
jgi:thymidylate synthase (FAD)